MNTDWYLRLFDHRPESGIELTFIRSGEHALDGRLLGRYADTTTAVDAAIKWARDRGARLTAPGIDAAQRAHLGGGIMTLDLIPVPLSAERPRPL